MPIMDYDDDAPPRPAVIMDYGDDAPPRPAVIMDYGHGDAPPPRPQRLKKTTKVSAKEQVAYGLVLAAMTGKFRKNGW